MLRLPGNCCRQGIREVIFGTLLILHTAVAPAVWMPLWHAGISPLTWATRSLGCEALVIAPLSMLVRPFTPAPAHIGSCQFAG